MKCHDCKFLCCVFSLFMLMHYQNQQNNEVNDMKINFYSKSKNNFGVWFIIAFALACLFLIYIGFSLHEERSLIKLKHAHFSLIKNPTGLSKKAQKEDYDVLSNLGMKQAFIRLK